VAGPLGKRSLESLTQNRLKKASASAARTPWKTGLHHPRRRANANLESQLLIRPSLLRARSEIAPQQTLHFFFIIYSTSVNLADRGAGNLDDYVREAGKLNVHGAKLRPAEKLSFRIKLFPSVYAGK
jgi:hypothetical protein